jgi:hypothetical protein
MSSKALSGGIIVGAGLLAALVSYVVFSSTPATLDAVEADTTTSTDAVVGGDPKVVYISADEIALGPAVLVPTDVSVVDRQVAIEYDLHQLAPIEGLPGGVAFVPFQGFEELTPAEAETVYPSTWTMVIDGTEVRGTVANPNARAARFQVPDGLTASRLESARIDSYHIQVPLDQKFSLSSDSPVVEIVPGITATLIRVSEQSSTTIVQVQVAVADPLNLGGIDVVGVGDGSVVSVRSAEGGPVWNLTYAGDATESFAMSLVGSMWFEIQGPWAVNLGLDDDG